VSLWLKVNLVLMQQMAGQLTMPWYYPLTWYFYGTGLSLPPCLLYEAIYFRQFSFNRQLDSSSGRAAFWQIFWCYLRNGEMWTI